MSVKHHDVVIIGGGMSGLLSGLKLANAGIHNFIILEESSSVGGTWLHNQYPGICCDIKSYAYLPLQYLPSFTPTRLYPSGEEILEFLEQLKTKYNLDSHIEYDKKVMEMKWLESECRWKLKTLDGVYYDSAYVIVATGPLNIPQWPETVSGLDRFKKNLCHTSTFDHQFDYRDKCVGIVGTGASAIQVIPQLSKIAKQVYVFQRSPPYCWPRNDSELSDDLKQDILQKGIPFIETLRDKVNRFQDNFAWETMNSDEKNKETQKFYTKYMFQIIKDKETAKAMIPDYPFGCKRALLSDDYLQCFNRKNVKLVHNPAGVKCVTCDGLVVGETEYKLDAIIFASGFKTGPIRHINIIGKNQVSLSQSYDQHGYHAAFGMCSNGFPNLFMMLSPQGWTAHGNTSEAIDIQSSWIVHMIKQNYKEEKIKYVEAKVEMEKIWAMDSKKFANMFKCSNWYKDFLWTGRWDSFVNELCKFSSSPADSFDFYDQFHNKVDVDDSTFESFQVSKPYHLAPRL